MSATSTSRAPGPSPAALDAVRAVTEFGAPNPDAAALRQAISAHYGIGENAVRVGGGTAALLHSIIAGRAASGGEVICSTPSWPPYANLAAAYGLQPRQIGLAGYDHDLSAEAAAVSANTWLVLIDSPHSVTGTTVDLEQARMLAAEPPRE